MILFGATVMAGWRDFMKEIIEQILELGGNYVNLNHEEAIIELLLMAWV
jgi:hypothetical protein